jgi:hypothetical protein
MHPGLDRGGFDGNGFAAVGTKHDVDDSDDSSDPSIL